MGDELHDIPYHIVVVRSQLTRNIGRMYPEIRDEVVTAFDQVLDLRGYGEVSFSRRFFFHSSLEHSEWKSVSSLGAIQKVVCRTNNRVFVGLPLCMFSLPLIPSLSFLIHYSRPQPRLDRSQHPLHRWHRQDRVCNRAVPQVFKTVSPLGYLSGD